MILLTIEVQILIISYYLIKHFEQLAIIGGWVDNTYYFLDLL
jgi:hypothetical protein